MRQQVNRLSMYGSSKRKAFEKNRVLLIEAKHSLQKKKYKNLFSVMQNFEKLVFKLRN